MPQCRTAGAADLALTESGRGGWGGIPSADRLLDFWIVAREFFAVFPVNQGGPRQGGYSIRDTKLPDVAGGAREGVSFGQFGPYLSSRGELDEKNSDGKCVCCFDWRGHACGGGL